ncbi:iron complex transport system substrate-binding protein [Propionibacterium cyclohexanicum]|uniref:Iron complex transport system substrate-binding protein n=1 Tax=Propionibacterium cyclohexanicum TaxID=64702 RepID=A0A1H9RXE9_9ACTN|nr:ABC transporter substrate-binding protein [Propionibacterium cyclohexanicum]SER77486.1 iron complex transport system substrate-binding protein [Propionibacterium cyclohexanicum]
MKARKAWKAAVLLTATLLAASACSSPSASPAASSASASTAGTVSVTNCNQQVSYPSPADKVFVNDSGMIAMMLAIGAEKNLVGISSLNRDHTVLSAHYGASALSGLSETSPTMASLETIVAKQPQVVVAGWNYGFKQGGVTPESLRAVGISPYVLSESCLQKQGEKARGIMDPWTALDTDLSNLGTITGHRAQASAVVSDIDARREALEKAPQATAKPNVLVFDSGDTTVFTSGRFGGPQAVITAAGGRNVMDDVADTWTTVSWEKVASSNADVIVFVDYGEQTFAQKTALLESNPATKDLPAVKAKRYLNLPYAMWVSSPLNIDAAEQLRHAMEQWSLVPKSELPQPTHDDHIEVSPAS